MPGANTAKKMLTAKLKVDIRFAVKKILISLALVLAGCGYDVQPQCTTWGASQEQKDWVGKCVTDGAPEDNYRQH